MADQFQLDQVRRALNRLSGLAQDDLQRGWDSLRTSDRMLINKALAEQWVGIIDQYGTMAATLAADLFEVRAHKIGIRPRVAIAVGVNPERATARLGWALSTADQVGNTLGLMDELVKQPYRSTTQDSAWLSRAAWARVPTGAETCAFCRMLGSRGAVYRTKERAGDGKSYHGHCDCVPTLVRGPEDYPKSYHPDALLDQYEAGRAQAESGDPKAILAAMRQQTGTN